MTDLTEKWKKGELPCGWHYIKIADIVFIDFFEGKVWKNKKDKYIDEVLAEVPSYKEWQKLKEFADYSIHNRNELTRQINFWMQENTKLKELLKECKEVISTGGYIFATVKQVKRARKLLENIEEVIK